MDVARCLGESNLVNGDLLPILSLWEASGQNSKYLSRIALACSKLFEPEPRRRGELTVDSGVVGASYLAGRISQSNDGQPSSPCSIYSASPSPI